jgi:tetratricopeptide (TPR) repeat protein
MWKGVGPWALGGLLLSGNLASRAAEAPPLADQLAALGRQAQQQGQAEQARSFFRNALRLDPNHAEARRGLGARGVERVALQPSDDKPAPADAKPDAEPLPADAPPPAPAPAAAPAPEPEATPSAPHATIEAEERLADVRRQQLVTDVEERLQRAHDFVAQGNAEGALHTLKLAQSLVRSAQQVPQATLDALDRRIQAQILSTVRAEERQDAERAEALRREAVAEQQLRALDLSARNQDTVLAMMVQFDSLMLQGMYNVLYNGGTGDIIAATAPFVEARLLAQKARAIDPLSSAPRAGVFTASTIGFLSQSLAYEELKEYRFMLTMQDVDRGSVPFPDTMTIEYPAADNWRALSERRIRRYGRAVDLLDRDPKTKSIIAKLDEPISMSFANETPLEDVLKYIKSATQGPNDSGIPIYVDPVGLQEAEKTMQSPVQLDLEGVPLKTTLRLMLKQLGLTYTVKDGMLTITSESSEDQPTEIRVYPVADLAIIPLSLMGGGGGGMGGGMGMMGGGMGGMGGGMGGMGGGGMMGGMGGGMGGMGMGGMGMMSVPPEDPRVLNATGR